MVDERAGVWGLVVAKYGVDRLVVGLLGLTDEARRCVRDGADGVPVGWEFRRVLSGGKADRWGLGLESGW